MRVNRTQVVGATIGLLALAASAPMAEASPPTGLTSTTLATGSLDRPVKVHNDGVRLRTKKATDIRVQQLVFAPGSSSGWHHHPGLVTIVVASGSVTLWDEHCKAKSYGPGLPNGAVFIESGDEPGKVTSAGGATNYATYIVPKADPAVFRIEDEAPRCAS
jgi:quercetin dioxygenase-like cupin family protein